MRTNRTQTGASILEALIVLSIIASLAAFTVPSYAALRRRVYVTSCQANMNEIAVAIRQYRHDHNGNMPWPLGRIAPQYISASKLVCPFVEHMAPEQVAAKRAGSRKFPWSSYFMFSVRGLDNLRNRGEAAFGYSEVLDRRKGDTPLVICRDHREPVSLNPFMIVDSAASNLPVWHFPMDPIIIVRWDGSVNITQKGGTRLSNSGGGTEQDLNQL